MTETALVKYETPQINKKVNIDKLLRLHFDKNTPQADIARLLNCSPSYVNKIIQKYRKLLSEDKELTASVADNVRTKMFKAGEMKVLQKIVNEKKLSEASLYHLFYGLKVLHSARRQEEGKHTGNLTINIMQQLNMALNRKDEFKDDTRIQTEE